MIPSIFHFRLFVQALKICAAIGVTLILLSIAEVIWYFNGNARFPADCGLVFGAAVHSRETPGPAITRRTQTAAGLYNLNYIKTLILTGGKGSDTQASEAAVMRKVAMLDGVDPLDILLEDQSSSTLENLLMSRADLTACDSVVAISDRYHLARIELIAHQLGIDLTTYPAQETPNRGFEIQSALREALGLIYYRIVFLLK